MRPLACSPVHVFVLGPEPPSLPAVRRALPLHWAVVRWPMSGFSVPDPPAPDLWLVRGSSANPPAMPQAPRPAMRIVSGGEPDSPGPRSASEVILDVAELGRLAEVAYAAVSRHWTLPPDPGRLLADLPWALRRAVLRLLYDPLPSVPEAAEALATAGRAPYPRQVDILAEELGVSRQYLFRVAQAFGMSLGELVRTATLLRGLVHQRLSGEPWEKVALRLGFRSGSAWTNFVTRLTGRPPSALGTGELDRIRGRLLGIVTGQAA